MSRLPAPWKCDYCGALKGATNHWWMRNTFAVGFLLVVWDDKCADLESKDNKEDGDRNLRPIYEHICSESCANKALSQWMSRQNDAGRPAVAVEAPPVVCSAVIDPELHFFVGSPTDSYCQSCGRSPEDTSVHNQSRRLVLAQRSQDNQ